MMPWIIAVVVMLVVIVVLFWLPRKIGEESERAAVRVACEKSLDITQNLRLFAGDLADRMGNAVGISCVTEYLDLNQKGEELTQEVADYLYDCWGLYGNRKNLFDQSTGTYCIICKSLTIHNADKIEELVDYLRTEKAPTIREGTYLQNFGGEAVLAQGAEARYDNYALEQGDSIAVVVAFGTLNFKGKHLIFNKKTGIGMLLHPYNAVDLANLGCYSFEGRTTSLEYRKER